MSNPIKLLALKVYRLFRHPPAPADMAAIAAMPESRLKATLIRMHAEALADGEYLTAANVEWVKRYIPESDRETDRSSAARAAEDMDTAEDTDTAERERRTRQFSHYLKLMRHRALELTDDKCFLIFSVGGRFVQFALDEGGLMLDLPNTTLSGDEADLITSENSRFEYAGEDDPVGDVEQFEDVIAYYEFDELGKAAEDTAYLFFDIYEEAVDVPIKIRAFSNDGWKQHASIS